MYASRRQCINTSGIGSDEPASIAIEANERLRSANENRSEFM